MGLYSGFYSNDIWCGFINFFSSFARTARRLSSMIRRQPNIPRQQLLRWTEYVGEFGNLEELHLAGTDLPFFSYFLLDIVVVFSLAVISLFILFSLLLLRICRRLKRTEKKNKTH
jgi:hypothetical protein